MGGLASQREKPRRRRHTFGLFRAEGTPHILSTARAHAFAPARPPSARLPSRPPTPPPVTSRRVECVVVAKATVEVGLAIAVLITHVTAARRRASSRRVGGAASVGVVISTSAAARCIPFVVRLIWHRQAETARRTHHHRYARDFVANVKVTDQGPRDSRESESESPSAPSVRKAKSAFVS